MKLLQLTAVALAMVIAAPAMAADKGGEPNYGLNIEAPKRNWTGVYFGVQVGTTLDGSVGLTENIPPALGVGSTLSSSYAADGWVGGAHIGMSKQFGQLVFGADLELDGGDLNGSTGNCLGIAALAGGGTTVNCQTDVNWLATATLRAGLAMGIWQVYGQAGWALAGVDHNIQAVIPPLGGFSLSNGKSEVADGLVFGAGASVQISPDWILSLDWKRYDLEIDGAGLALGGVVSSGSTDLEFDTVKARLSIKF
jgi:outer membrane immunogenic protein